MGSYRCSSSCCGCGLAMAGSSSFGNLCNMVDEELRRECWSCEGNPREAGSPVQLWQCHSTGME